MSATVNFVEFALDIITPFAFELKREVSVGFVQRWHGTKQVTIFPNGNFRTGDLGRPGLTFQAYDDKPSKVTGEIDCFHLEGKVNGVRALRQLGINSISDLLTFDHARFWQRHFITAEMDMARFGRHHANVRDGTKRRAPLIHRTKSGFVYNVDAAVGNVLWRVFAALPDEPGYSLQQLLDRYRGHSYVMACRNDHSGAAALLHRFNVLPGPDMGLLVPEFCYPPRPRREKCTSPRSRPRPRENGCAS